MHYDVRKTKKNTNLLADEATPQNIPSKLSKQALPSKKNTLSGTVEEQ